jgi:AcrR family transcriptional regulator
MANFDKELSSLGLRERNKHEKLFRIRSAAKNLFHQNGFDITTTRQIAKEARVGLATLFLYASDKRDLLFLVCNDDLDKLTENAFKGVPDDAPLLEQLTIVFRHFFIFFSQDIPLYRDLMRELTFYTSGHHSQRFQAIRNRTIHLIQVLIENSKSQAKIGSPENSELIAQIIFSIYAAHLRTWMTSANPLPEIGVREIQKQFKLLIVGLIPKDGAL